jgi:hypothetical protein
MAHKVPEHIGTRFSQVFFHAQTVANVEPLAYGIQKSRP